MSGNYRNSQQQEQYYQQGGYYPGQEHMGTVYYQQPQYVNPQQFHQQQIPPPMSQQMYYQQQPYYNQGYQGQVYHSNNQEMMHGGYTDPTADMMQNRYQGPPRGRGRGQRRMGGRGRGYQSQGRHKRYNENQIQIRLFQQIGRLVVGKLQWEIITTNPVQQFKELKVTVPVKINQYYILMKPKTITLAKRKKKVLQI